MLEIPLDLLVLGGEEVHEVFFSLQFRVLELLSHVGEVPQEGMALNSDLKAFGGGAGGFAVYGSVVITELKNDYFTV